MYSKMYLKFVIISTTNNCESNHTRILQSCTTNYLPWNISDLGCSPKCSSSVHILQLCKVLSVSALPLRRSCTNKTHGQTDININTSAYELSNTIHNLLLVPRTLSLFTSPGMSWNSNTSGPPQWQHADGNSADSSLINKGWPVHWYLQHDNSLTITLQFNRQ